MGSSSRNTYIARRQKGHVDCGTALVHALLIQPRAVLLVQALNVVNEPAVQEEEQFAYIHGLAALQPGDGLLEQPQQTLVLVAVGGQAREAMLLHQLLLTPEVQACELNQLVQQFVHRNLLMAADHRQAKLIHRVHNVGVLIVHSLHAHAARMLPLEKRSHLHLCLALRLPAADRFIEQVTVRVIKRRSPRGRSGYAAPLEAAGLDACVVLGFRLK